MRVHVKLNATLRRYVPANADGDTVLVDLEPGATVDDLLAALAIPTGYTKMVVSAGEHLASATVLHEGQHLSLFPPLAG